MIVGKEYVMLNRDEENIYVVKLTGMDDMVVETLVNGLPFLCILNENFLNELIVIGAL